MLTTLTRSLRVAADALEAEGARRALRLARPRANSAEELSFIKGFAYGHVRPAPNQIDSEILALLERVKSLEPSTVVEIGRAGGGSLYLLTRVCPDDAVIISVDTGGAPRAQGRFFAAFARANQRVEILWGDSHHQQTMVRRVRSLVHQSIDLLFIDGDHSYEGVRLDYELYSPLVRTGGAIAFHDIVPGTEQNVGGVPRLWKELKDAASDTEEIVECWDQQGFGIGLLRKA
jgi:predicted O-methyltransferase YrrM